MTLSFDNFNIKHDRHMWNPVSRQISLCQRSFKKNIDKIKFLQKCNSVVDIFIRRWNIITVIDGSQKWFLQHQKWSPYTKFEVRRRLMLEKTNFLCGLHFWCWIGPQKLPNWKFCFFRNQFWDQPLSSQRQIRRLHSFWHIPSERSLLHFSGHSCFKTLLVVFIVVKKSSFYLKE